MNELELLQAVRLKGRVSLADLAATLATEPDAVSNAVDELVRSGFVLTGKALRLTPAGRQRLSELLGAERSQLDHDAVAAIHAAFRPVNAEFKALIADWQVKDGQPNPHDDPSYDEAVLARLEPVHEGASALITEASAHVPRLGAYAEKLTSALDRVRAGDLIWLTRPIIDSYHTVWFELHEELIDMAGLTRHEEALAGHAE
ncbi:hypothetical protein A4G26_14910 [Mycobacterium kansasii]|uniref:Uncharacterized protein n=1 Tax=Mycobacterium innocens TaxID=2341083 RepID=A0A498QIH0_9MYCO|nr:MULTISPECIES: winged helix DNA-binding protein [Mycobacterium]KZS57893.1 hypothetical protein A4G26_14910 [Mycobacterium kansasii]VBA45990.1 hypothetical protein LAUMK13_05571 [Mycobacterium innocens]